MARVRPSLRHTYDLSGLGLSVQTACRARQDKLPQAPCDGGQGSTYHGSYFGFMTSMTSNLVISLPTQSSLSQASDTYVNHL
jgi:hypothetical protein